MAYQNSSAAYQVSVYENAVPKPKQQTRDKLRVVQSKHRRYSVAALLSPRVFSSFAIVITLICLMIYNQAKLTEITGDISKINNQLEILESENLILSSQLDSAVSIRTVEEYAKNELGMQKLDKFQIEYITLYEEDAIGLTEDAPRDSLSQRLKQMVNSAVSTVKEYIGGS